ncbi:MULTISPECIES: histidine kinase [unclassified Tolypothrix]|nr:MULTISPECIES: histidine kinase [unclassified Tolypothrix]
MGIGDWGLGTGEGERDKKLFQCPMPYALCPMPYALCPMPHAPCPFSKL